MEKTQPLSDHPLAIDAVIAISHTLLKSISNNSYTASLNQETDWMNLFYLLVNLLGLKCKFLKHNRWKLLVPIGLQLYTWYLKQTLDYKCIFLLKATKSETMLSSHFWYIPKKFLCDSNHAPSITCVIMIKYSSLRLSCL